MKKYQNIITVICLTLVIGFFFYGLINNIQAKNDKEISLKARIELEEFKKNAEYTIKVAEDKTRELVAKEHQLMKALEETQSLSKVAIKRN